MLIIVLSCWIDLWNHAVGHGGIFVEYGEDEADERGTGVRCYDVVEDPGVDWFEMEFLAVFELVAEGLGLGVGDDSVGAAVGEVDVLLWLPSVPVAEALDEVEE